MLVHEQGFHGVAHPRALQLGVQANPLRLVQIGRGVHVGVTQAGEMLDDRDGRGAGDGPDQFLATARNDDVDVGVLLQQQAHRVAVGRAHELHGRVRQAGLGEGARQYVHDGAVGLERLGAAFEQHCVAGLDA